MLTKYLDAAMHTARYETLADGMGFYAEIPGLDGVYAYAATYECARDELLQVLEEWILFRVSRNLPIPADQETLFLVSMSGMRESILKGMASPVEECADELDW